MEVINANGETIITDFKTVRCGVFLKTILPQFEIVMVGVSGGREPYAHIYFQIDKQEAHNVIDMCQCDVTFSIMYNSKVKSDMIDYLYIKKLKPKIK